MNFPLMPVEGWLLALACFGILFACVKPLGIHMAKVYSGESTFLTPVFGALERLLYKIAGVDPEQEMDARVYAVSLLLFTLVNFGGLFALLWLQGFMAAALPLDLIFNVAVSFVTNTNWQAYGHDSAIAIPTQTLGLVVQQFVSPAVGLAVLAAASRGFTRANAKTIGNFWADVTRGVLYVLLPMAVVFALALAGLDVAQTFEPYALARWLDPLPGMDAVQTIALGPIASQTAIQQLGGNGGGFFLANLAHPLANPTPLTGFFELLAILMIPMAQCVMFGRMAKDSKQGWALLVTMLLLFAPCFLFTVAQEQQANPLLTSLGIESAAGNREGKEVRMSVPETALWATAATATSNGSANASLDSFTPLGLLAPMALMQIGEVVFGGVGSGLYGMLVFVLIAVFVAGLMVGRTPEYLGKKIGAFEMKMAVLAALAPSMAALIGTAIAVSFSVGKNGAFNPYAQGFSEILYAFTSAANNNGGALGGLAADTPFYNAMLGLAMLAGRLGLILPVLAMAGSLAPKPILPPCAGTLSTATPTFALMLAGTIVMVGVLTFAPTLALGPVAEHFHGLALAAAGGVR